MKTTFIYIAFFMFAFIGHTQAQNKLFEKLADNDNVTVVYISKSLLSMANNLDLGADGPDFKKLANKLDQIEIYSCDDDAKTIAMMKTEIKSLNNSSNLESFMTIKDKGQNVKFYGLKVKDIFKDLIMTVEGNNLATIIRIKGNFTSNDIQNVMKNTTKK